MAHLWLANISGIYPGLTDVPEQDAQGLGRNLRGEEAVAGTSVPGASVPESALALSY